MHKDVSNEVNILTSLSLLLFILFQRKIRITIIIRSMLIFVE